MYSTASRNAQSAYFDVIVYGITARHISIVSGSKSGGNGVIR